MSGKPYNHDASTIPFSTLAFGDELAKPSSPRLRIFSAEGIQAYALKPGANKVGRGRDVDVRLVGDDISREHALLILEDGTASLEDLTSVNGTFVLGKRLEPYQRVMLTPGQPFRLATSHLCVLEGTGTFATPSDAKAPEAVDDPLQTNLLAERVATTDLSVVLQGETGVGKELMVRRIHALSKRAQHPLVSVNCAAIPEGLLESELFGHVRGAFSGATKDKIGLVAAAHLGTLFLDEIGEMPLTLQTKLLRTLEDREIRPVGSTQVLQVDVRFISATHRNLHAEVKNGTFRHDLYFRLNGITIRIPPLRERRAQIPGLARELVRQAAQGQGRAGPPTLSDESIEALCSYDWPGNVRELRNVLERAIALSDDGTITTHHLLFDAAAPSPFEPESGQASGKGEPPNRPGQLKQAVQSAEKERIQAVLSDCNFNQSHAAKVLGIARGTLRKRIRAFGIKLPDRSGSHS